MLYSTLEKFDTPDQVHTINIDRRSLPPGNYQDGGYESRQVVDIETSRIVTEYRAQVLINEKQKRFVATFPEGITRPIQYGNQIKAHSVYLSQYQLLPYNRIEEYFSDQLNIPISPGKIECPAPDESKRKERQRGKIKRKNHTIYWNF